MKTTIITLVAVALLSMNNAFGRDHLYRNVEINDEAHTTITTVCKGVDDKYLSPVKRYLITSDLNGNPIEKIIYIWNNDNNNWEALQKYNYDYNRDGQLFSLAFAEWNKTTKSWNENTQYAMLVNPQLYDIDYLSIEPIESDLNLIHNFN